MVEDREDREDRLDRAFGALSDRTRRHLLDQLQAGPHRITDLAAPLPMTFAAVAKHIRVLETAGLVTRTKRGREQWVSVEAQRFRTAEDWLSEHTQFWASRAAALASMLDQDQP